MSDVPRFNVMLLNDDKTPMEFVVRVLERFFDMSTVEATAHTHARISRKGSRWFVPAENGAGRYTVTLHSTSPHCTCPDHETTGRECKHIYAVQWALRWKRDDLRNIERVDRDEGRGERKTYPQNWRAYNAAQTGEKDMFLDLLFDLCSGVNEPVRPKTGRPRIPIQDAIFAACFKVYSTVSCRRFMCDLREVQEKGYLSKLPHFNSIFNYLKSHHFREASTSTRNLVPAASPASALHPVKF